MQSVLQYRRIRLAAVQQIERDTEKAGAFAAVRHLRRPNNANNTGGIEDEDNSNDDDDSEPAEQYQEVMNRLSTQQTRYSARTALGYSITGVDARARATNETEAGHVFVVGWEGEDDPLKPSNWPRSKRITATIVVSFIAIAGTAASSIDAAVLPQYSAYWHVSEVAGTLATAMYLFGFSIGAQFVGPFSEALGRNIVYIATMVIYMLFLMACGLAPSYGAHITLRFFAGIFASSPLTVAGGTWNLAHLTCFNGHWTNNCRYCCRSMECRGKDMGISSLRLSGFLRPIDGTSYCILYWYLKPELVILFLTTTSETWSLLTSN